MLTLLCLWHIAWCQGLTDGYTCHCYKAPPTNVSTSPISPEMDSTTIKVPIPHTTIQQLNNFYPDKASYLTFWTKVVHEPSFAAFDYAYHSHCSIKHQIKITKELLVLLQTMDETHITAVEAALIQMCKGSLEDGIFSKTTTIKEDGWEKTTTTYLYDAPPSKNRRSTYPQKKVSFLTPQETGLLSGSCQNPIIIEDPLAAPRPWKRHFSWNTCFKCSSSQHAVIHCSSYKCWPCDWTAPGHYQHNCPQHPKNLPNVLKDRDYYDNYISADTDYNQSGEFWIIYQSIINSPMPHPLPISTSFLFPSSHSHRTMSFFCVSATFSSMFSFQPIHNHPQYYLPSGDLYILTQAICFHIYKYFFEHESVHFWTIFETSPIVGSMPGFSLDLSSTINPDELELFLSIIYNPKYNLYNLSIRQWFDVQTYASVWQFSRMYALAKREIENICIKEMNNPELVGAFRSYKLWQQQWYEQLLGNIYEEDKWDQGRAAEVRFGLVLATFLLNLEPDFRFSSGNMSNFEPDHRFRVQTVWFRFRRGLN